MAIKLLIDSASDITKKEAETLGMHFISEIITFGTKDYLDGDELLANEFYELLETQEFPKTSQIIPARFKNAFKELTEDGSELIVITMSSKLSGTYLSALNAKQSFDNVYVVDSLNASLGERLLCLHAKNLIDQGLKAQEIYERLEEDKYKINYLAIINTLEYLKKGGRVSAAVAFAGDLLSIKPIASVIDGEVRIIGKTVGVKKACKFVNNQIDKLGGFNYDMPNGVIYSGNEDSLLQKYFENSKHMFKEGVTVNKYVLGSTIGSHIGPGSFGIAFFDKAE